MDTEEDTALEESLQEYLKDYSPHVWPFREKAFRKAWDAWEETGPLEKVLCVAVMNGWARKKQRELDRKESNT